MNNQLLFILKLNIVTLEYPKNFKKRSYVDAKKSKKSWLQTNLIWCQKLSIISVCCLKVSLDGQHSPSSMCLYPDKRNLKRHTPLWSMMNALCQINRNVRKKTLKLSLFYFHEFSPLLAKNKTICVVNVVSRKKHFFSLVTVIWPFSYA